MKYTAALIVVSAAVARAQFNIDPTTDAITCSGNPNANYCASDSLTSNIIIRCTNGTGQAGNCNDNTAGQFPLGNIGGSLCFQSSTTAGDGACEKNCVVFDTTSFTLPLLLCTPSATQTSSGASSTGVSASVPGSSSVSVTTISSTTSVYTTLKASSTSCSESVSPVTKSTPASSSVTVAPVSSAESSSSPVTVTSTGTSSYMNGKTTIIVTFTTTYCPESSATASSGVKTATPAGPTTTLPASVYTHSKPDSSILSSITAAGNVTTPAVPTSVLPYTVAESGSSAAASNGTGTTPTSAVPVGPTTSAPGTYTGAGIANSAGAGLAVVGLLIAYFL